MIFKKKLCYNNSNYDFLKTIFRNNKSNYDFLKTIREVIIRIMIFLKNYAIII